MLSTNDMEVLVYYVDGNVVMVVGTRGPKGAEGGKREEETNR